MQVRHLKNKNYKMKTDSPGKIIWIGLPPTSYEKALHLQQQIVRAKREKEIAEDAVLALEHPPVFTLGRNGGRENLIISEELLAEKGIRIFRTERGGNITFHGPGQIVVYPILDMNRCRMGVREYVEGLEEVMVRTVGEWGIAARGDAENRGLWVGKRKLGSIGVAVRHWITFHGLALNVNMDLTPFSWINPCGLHNIKMSTMEKECGQKISLPQVLVSLQKHLLAFLYREAIPGDEMTEKYF
jgi:lipoate-protein ligase B